MILEGQAARDWLKGNSKFLSDKEMECSCCKQIKLDTLAAVKFNMIRSGLGRAIRVNSGYRCSEHNTAVKGYKKSPHMLGYALDLAVADSTSRHQILELFYTYGIKRIGLGSTFLHMDVAIDGYDQFVSWNYNVRS